MSTDIVPFNYGDHTIRSLMIEGEPWWVAQDISRALGYRSPKDAVRQHVDAEDKGAVNHPTLGGSQKLITVNESGMYALIFGSKLSTAKAFKRWITHEVLPELRRTGEYRMAQMDPDQRELELAERLAAAARERIAIKAELAITAPKAAKHDRLVKADGGGYWLASVGRQLGFDGLLRVFNNLLIDMGALRRTPGGKLTPTDEWIARGWMTTRHPRTTVVTEEGFAYLDSIDWDEA